jgi:hypothetical protein
MLRQSRRHGVLRRYHQAAIVYVVFGLVVMATSLLPGMISEVRRASAGPGLLAAGAVAILLVGALIWRGHRKFTLLLVLTALYRVAAFTLNALGWHFEFALEASRPSSWADLAAVRRFIEAELATGSPFHELIALGDRPPVALPDAIGPVALPANLGLQPPIASAAQAVLMLVVALFLSRAGWRAP